GVRHGRDGVRGAPRLSRRRVLVVPLPARPPHLPPRHRGGGRAARGLGPGRRDLASSGGGAQLSARPPHGPASSPGAPTGRTVTVRPGRGGRLLAVLLGSLVSAAAAGGAVAVASGNNGPVVLLGTAE